MSQFLRLNLNDLSKGLVVAVLVAVLQLVLALLQNKGLSLTPEDGVAILDIALKSGAAYLLKNLLTDADGKVAGIALGKK